MLRRVKQNKIFKEILVDAVARIHAVLNRQAERLEEFFVFLAVVRKKLLKLRLYLFLDIGRDNLELAVVLEHLTRNIERQVGRIDKAAHKSEAVGQKLLALVHYHDAV